MVPGGAAGSGDGPSDEVGTVVGATVVAADVVGAAVVELAGEAVVGAVETTIEGAGASPALSSADAHAATATPHSTATPRARATP